MLEELDFEDELPAMESTEVNSEQHNSTEETETDPVSGEILDDEIVDDLEEGEIKEASPVPSIKDASPIPSITRTRPVPPIMAAHMACRHFQQGTCVYGSRCRFLHLSPEEESYEVFDSVISNSNNLIVRPAFHNRAFFHHPPMHTEPEFKSAWEIGIENAKIIRQKAKLKRIEDDLGLQDNETAWEISLQETKTMIQRATVKKRKELLGEATLYSKEEKFKEQAPVRNLGDRFWSSHSESNREKNAMDRPKDGCYNARKLKSAIGVRRGFYQWDDPWRRSKSPTGRKRPRFRSISSSPRHSRKRSSRSSSSSCFKRRIYGSCSQQKPSPKKKRPKSCSISPLKLCKPFKGHSKEDLKHSVSRSFSRSPLRNKHSHSCSLSRSSSASSPRQKLRKQVESDGVLKLKKCLKETTTQNSRRSSPKKIWLCKSYSGIASSPHRDDGSNSSDMTASSSSCTSSSSVSDTDSSQHDYVVQKDKDFPRSKIRWIPHQYGVRTVKKRSSNGMNSNLRSQTAMAKGTYKSSITNQKPHLSKRGDTAMDRMAMDRNPNKEVLRTVSIKPFSISNRTKLAKPVAMETQKRPLPKRNVKPQVSSSQESYNEKFTKKTVYSLQRKEKPRKTSASLADSLDLLKYQACVNSNSSINEIDKLKAPKKSKTTSAMTADPSEEHLKRWAFGHDDAISDMNKQIPSKTSAVNIAASELIKKHEERGKNKDPIHKVKQLKPRKLAVTAVDLELLKYQACVPINSPVKKEVCKKSSDSLKVSGDSESIASSDSKTEIYNKKELLLQQLKLVEAAIARKKYM